MQHQISKTILANGLTAVIVPLQGTEAVTSIVFMGVGSRFESDAQRGLAHFTEHMVFKGGRKYLNAQAVAQALDAVGGEFNAFTGEEFTGFFTKTDSRHLELGLDVLSDMVLHATFPKSELEKEKGVIAEELNMYEDMPMRKVHNVLSSLVFGDTPLGRPIIGTKETTGAFTVEDFHNYRKQFYMGEQCCVVIAGSFGDSNPLELIEQYFGELPKGAAYTASAAVKQQGRRVEVESKQSEQTHLVLATPGITMSDPKRHIFRTLTTILGGNMSSRLFVSVREEQGLCYYVRSVPDSYVDTGMVAISAGVDNNRLPLAVSAIVHELQKLRDTAVDPEELERAKQFQIGKLLLGLEDSEQVAEFYGLQQLLEHDIETPEQIKQSVESVTAEEVQQLARELFVASELRLAVIGPHQDAAALDLLLTLT